LQISSIALFISPKLSRIFLYIPKLIVIGNKLGQINHEIGSKFLFCFSDNSLSSKLVSSNSLTSVDTSSSVVSEYSISDPEILDILSINNIRKKYLVVKKIIYLFIYLFILLIILVFSFFFFLTAH